MADAMRSEGLDLLRVLAYCPWEQRAAVAVLSPEVRQKLGYRAGGSAEARGGRAHWSFLCERLVLEHNVHVPQPLPSHPDAPPPGVADSWQSLFLELFRARRRLDGSAAEDGQDGAKEQLVIKVAARFRSSNNVAGEDDEEEQVVVLPLHQKVQMVRGCTGCSKKEAMEIIMRERGLTALGDPYEKAEAQVRHRDNKENDDSNHNSRRNNKAFADGPEEVANADDFVEVEASDDEAAAAKLAGFATGVATSDGHASILAVREDAGSILAMAPGVGLREFTFDRVFSEKTKQVDTYDRAAQRLIMEFLNGVNTSIVCYGQTGSGKTYTMFGPPGKKLKKADQGIVPRACLEVLTSMRERRGRGVEVELGMSYVQVFGSEVSDLLKSGQVVGQGQDGRYANTRATDRVGHRYVLDGKTECSVESWDEVQELLELGEISKRVSATAMNERSTRAHTLLVLTLTQKAPSGFEVKSRLFLADLGGSEKIAKSKADAGLVAPVLMVGGEEVNRVSWAEYYSHRQRIQETQQINKGLFALKTVIDALNTRQQMINQGAPLASLPYVPYQNSKLTMLLKDALGGTSRTLVFCTASMDSRHALESLQTLRFGERCGQVQQRPDADKAASVQAALRQLEADIQAVEAEIVRKERWETRLIRRTDVDTVAGSFGDPTYTREEVIPTSVLVGAEKDREDLEVLLQRQMDLQGLGGFVAKDYRDMKLKEAADGGRGMDFRSGASFHSKTKAKEFELDGVVETALRFFFRRSKLAERIFGETEASRHQRVASEQLHENYQVLAQFLRTRWEDATAAGSEKRTFGKAMLDLTREWTTAFRDAPEKRDEALARLVVQVPQLLQAGSPSSAAGGGYPVAASSSSPSLPVAP